MFGADEHGMLGAETFHKMLEQLVPVFQSA